LSVPAAERLRHSEYGRKHPPLWRDRIHREAGALNSRAKGSNFILADGGVRGACFAIGDSSLGGTDDAFVTFNRIGVHAT
jgi:hypothetical protein